MGFITSNIVYVINVIEDIIATSKSPHPLNMSIGYCEENSKKFMKLSFSLENGTAEIKIYDDDGICSYINRSKENVRSIKFTASNLTNTETPGSFHQALKEVRNFERQNSSTPIHSIDTSIDRTSFGLSNEH
jgi:hypothetical protein